MWNSSYSTFLGQLRIVTEQYLSLFRSGYGLYLYASGNRYKGHYKNGKKVRAYTVHVQVIRYSIHTHETTIYRLE